MSFALVWYPLDGSAPLTLGASAPFKLLSMDGLSETVSAPHVQKGPGQVGATLLDHEVAPRVITLQVAVLATSREDYWTRRQQLASAFAARPARHGAAPAVGRLRLSRDDLPTVVELDAVPRESPKLTPRSPLAALADIELLAPDPDWRAIADEFRLLEETGGGFQWPLEFPLEIVANNVEVEIVNSGNVDAPPLLRMYGEITTGRLLNLTTGETIEVTGTVNAGDYLEIETAFGRKAITLVQSNGARTNVMDRLNLSLADFWHLRPGSNVVRFEASVNVSGKATVHWRPRWSGV